MDKDKKYIVRKFIMAKSIEEAFRKEKKAKPDEVYLDMEYQRMMEETDIKPIRGFNKK